LNGLPAVVVENIHDLQGIATRFTVHCQVDETGRIKELDIVLAPSKLTAVD
jgi:hypothetical protein